MGPVAVVVGVALGLAACGLGWAAWTLRWTGWTRATSPGRVLGVVPSAGVMLVGLAAGGAVDGVPGAVADVVAGLGAVAALVLLLLDPPWCGPDWYRTLRRHRPDEPFGPEEIAWALAVTRQPDGPADGAGGTRAGG